MVVRQYAPVALSRARYTEDALNRAVERGTRQYVLLGAGLDSYPYRRPAAHREVTVLELDHPATQGEKLARLAQLGWRIPDRVHHLPVDFAEQELGRVLAESPYDPAGPGFFSWLGVTYYLTRAAIQETLRAIATIARPGTAVVFDYLDRIALEPGQATPRIQVMLEITRLAGEPVITGFDPATLAAELAPLGFELAENLSPARIQHRYFADRTDGYQADQQTWFATAVVT